MANHMLFHVVDQRAAMREVRRVLHARGRLVAAANALAHGLRLHEIHTAAARELGYEPVSVVSNRFNLDQHMGLLEEVFPRVERHVRHDAFVFPSAEPAVRYYASGPVDAIEDRPADGSHRERLIALVQAKLEAIIARDGEFRDPKDVGCFVGYA